MEPIIYNGFIIQENLCSDPAIVVWKVTGGDDVEYIGFSSVDEAKAKIDEWVIINEEDLKLYERERKA